MSTPGERRGPRRRSRRSTMYGIALLVALVIIVIAVVWGIQRWGEDDEMTGPSVTAPTEMSADAAWQPYVTSIDAVKHRAKGGIVVGGHW